MALKSLTIDDLLEGLREEGARDSSGAFTVDLSRAAEKMRSFQLPNPHFYCLKWLQAAVLAQAARFIWRSDRSQVSVNIPGMALPLERLSALPSLLFESGVTAAERHMAAGLNGVIQTKARSLTLSSWDGQQGRRVVWSSGRCQVTSYDLPGEPATTSLLLERTPADKWAEFWYAANHHWVGHSLGKPNARDREQKILHQRGAYADLRLDIQGYPPDYDLLYYEPPSLLARANRLLGTPLTPAHMPFVRELWYPSSNTTGFMPLSRAKSYHAQVPQRGERCHTYLGIPNKPHPYSELHIVRDGILLDPLKIFPDRRGAVFVCCGSTLNTDLTGLQIIQDQAFQELLARLDNLYQEALQSTPLPVTD